METPLEIVFEGMKSSDSLKQRIESEIAKLEQFHGRITSCRAVIEAPHRRGRKGHLYTVKLHLNLPGGGEIAVSRDPGQNHAHEDAYVAIRDAFAAARRQLQDFIRKQEGKVKTHEVPPHGRILRLFREQGYGFIESVDGREIYFHENSVINQGFSNLNVDGEVRFEETMGDNGPQATVVQPIGKHHLSDKL